MMFVIGLTTVMALEKPTIVPLDNILQQQSVLLSVAGDFDLISAPVLPNLGDNTFTSCDAWAIKDEYCIGEVRHYDQCHQKLDDNNLWQPHSEVCNADFPNNTCLAGKCVKKNDIFQSILFIVLIAGALIFGYQKLFKKGGRRR